MTALRDQLDSLGRAQRWALLGVISVVAYGIAAITLPQGLPLPIVGLGMLQGAASALTALGLILIWRSNRFINFAYGAMGACTGVTASRLFISWHWNYWLVLVIGVASGVLAGMLIEFVVIRRFQNSSRLVLTVASIGLTQLLGGLEILLPSWIFHDNAMTLGGYKTPLSRFTWNTDSYLFVGDHLLILITVPIVVAALGWFLTRTQAGIAIRAAAENDDRARLLGIPTRRLQTIVWAIAGGLATLTLLLKAPFAGTPPTAGAGPALLLPAMAAAVVARMESLPVAVAAALGIGVMDQAIRWNVSGSPSLPDVFLLGVILVSLLTQRSRSRAHDQGGSWQDSATVKAIPARLRRLPEGRIARFLMLAALAAGVVALPLMNNLDRTNSVTVMMIWGIVGVSLVVLTGWSGQVSLGQFGLVGVGAMIAGNLIMANNVDLFVSMALAAAGAGLLAFLLGVPALRIKGPFLGVVTLAFAVVLDGYVLNPNTFPNLIPQSVDRPALWGRLDLENENVFYYFVAAFLLLAIVTARGLRRARSGRALVAIRDNPKAAEAMAVPSRRIALSGFVFAGILAGIAGTLDVLFLHGARAQSFPPSDSVDLFSMATIGGLGSIGGALSGIVGMRSLIDLVSSGIRLIVSGTGLLLVLWLLPGGFGSIGVMIRDRLLRLMARRRGLDAAGVEERTIDPVRSSAEPIGLNGSAPVTRQISCHDVCVSYGQLQVLFDVDFDVEVGEIVALLGTNGAGKSTLLKAICGLVDHRGSVRLGGVDLSGRRPEQIVGDGVALMSGGKSMFPTLTVAEHLRLATWTFRRDVERIAADTEAVLTLFPSLRSRLDNLAGDLSGGEQQQLALAQTMMLRPRVLLIDELSLGLSPVIVSFLLNVVRRLHALGVTIVVVEQSVNVALALADRAVFMEKGAVRFEGPTRELVDRPDILRSVFLEGAAALGGSDTESDDAPGDLVRLDISRFGALESATWPTDAPDAIVLRCEGVAKRFGGVMAVDHVDLQVRAGEIVGLVGQNGAGKTTLLDCISGFHDIDVGRIIFRDHDITNWAPFERAAGRLGRSFQEARLFPSLTVTETVSVACERVAGCRSMVADATRQPASYESELAIAARAAELVDLLGLTDHADKLTSELSTGTRRIVELACLLAEDPVLLLLDEPSAGVAQKETEALGPLLKRIRDHTGAAMLVIEHDMPLLAGLCDRMVALELGAVIAEGTPAEVLADEHVVSSYLGTDSSAINRSGVAAG